MRHEAFLNERSVSEKTGHSHYTHNRLRTAYNSLKRHLPWLFTFEDFPALSPKHNQSAGRKIRRHEAAFEVPLQAEESK